MPEFANLPYPDRLAELQLTTLEERRIREDMIQVHKLIHRFGKVNAWEDFLRLETGANRERTRGHALKLQKPRHRLHRRNQFFTSKVVDHWNQLPFEVVMSTNTSTFKNIYDKHVLLRRGIIP